MLRDEAVELASSAEAADLVAAIVATAARAGVPAPPPGDLPWLWLAGGEVAPEARAHAVARGAYDVVDADAGDAGARLVARVRELSVPQPPVPDTSRFVAESEAARSVLRQLARAARTSMPVLLTGETGTGKEVAAQRLHV